jgi:hypothetical protein
MVCFVSSISFNFFLFMFISTPFTPTTILETSAQTKEEVGAIFHNGNILKPFLDVPRRTKKRYPYCNSTSEALNQYREEIPNGNAYNLVGENVGEGTIMSDNVSNITTAYARHFVSSALDPSTQGRISMGRYDVSTVRLNNMIIVAGGVTFGDSGKAQKQVDIWNSVRNTVMASIPNSFILGSSTITVDAIPAGLAVPTDAKRKIKIEGIGIQYDTYVTKIAGTTLTLSRQTNGPNTGTQVRYRMIPGEPITETGSWSFSGPALSIARQGMAACSNDVHNIAMFGGGYAIEAGNVEISLYNAVDIYKNGIWSTSVFPEKAWSAVLPSTNAAEKALHDRSHKRYDAEAVILNGKAYFAGGVSGIPVDVTLMFERRVDVYDIATNTWSLLPGPPINQYLKCVANNDYYCPDGMYRARANFAFVACDLPSTGYGAGNDLLIFAGGMSGGGYFSLAEPTKYLSQVDIFDVTANTWLPITYFPSGIGRANLASAYFDGKVYFVGGATATRFTDAVDIYDPRLKKWIVSPSVCCGAHNYDTTPKCKTSFADPRCSVQRLSQPRSNPLITVLEYQPNINYKPNKVVVTDGGNNLVAGSTACTSNHLCIKQFDEMLVIVGGLTGGSSSRWFFEGRGMASPRIDFIKGAHSYWQDLQGAVETSGNLIGVPTEVLTEHFMHDVMSRGIMDGAAVGVNGKLHVVAGLTNLHLPSLRMEILNWKRPFICTSISRDNDMCAFANMERIKTNEVEPIEPTCDYQFLPEFKPWFCPCPNIRGIALKDQDPINYDKECASGGKATWSLASSDTKDFTKCRTSPQCFTKCYPNEEAIAAKEHIGDQSAWDDCPGLWVRPFGDTKQKAYMMKNDITVPYFGVHKFDSFNKRVTFGVVQTKYRDVKMCPRNCLPCGERATREYPGFPYEGPCTKPGGVRESGCVGNDRTKRKPNHPDLTRVVCEDVKDKGVSASTLY